MKIWSCIVKYHTIFDLKYTKLDFPISDELYDKIQNLIKNKKPLKLDMDICYKLNDFADKEFSKLIKNYDDEVNYWDILLDDPIYFINLKEDLIGKKLKDCIEVGEVTRCFGFGNSFSIVESEVTFIIDSDKIIKDIIKIDSYITIFDDGEESERMPYLPAYNTIKEDILEDEND